MAYDIKDVRTAMDTLDNQYQFVLIIIFISLIIAAGISVLFTAGPEPDQRSNSFVYLDVTDNTGQNQANTETG